MNGTCAGGTGAFIDQMATLLQTDAAGLDELAGRYQHLYPIASRCGVFAKTDLQPLINEGAAQEDLAASVFQAVATQTIAGLACGRPIRGQVVFLGGPLHFLPQLRQAFERALWATQVQRVHHARTTPSCMSRSAPPCSPAARAVHCRTLRCRAGRRRRAVPVRAAGAALRPLFADAGERAEFDHRHARGDASRQRDLVDGGRAVLPRDRRRHHHDQGRPARRRRQIVFSHYAANQGDPVAAAVDDRRASSATRCRQRRTDRPLLRHRVRRGA